MQRTAVVFYPAQLAISALVPGKKTSQSGPALLTRVTGSVECVRGVVCELDGIDAMRPSIVSM